MLKYSTNIAADHFNLFGGWWWKNGNILNAFNELRVPFIEEGIRSVSSLNSEYIFNMTEPLRGLKVLDVGCGGGILSESLARRGGTITGLDVGNEVIEVAKRHAALDPTLSDINYVCSSIEEYAANNQEIYDVVIASEVIEHVEDPKKFLEACVQCVKPGGSIFITTINKTYAAWFLCIFLCENVFTIIPKGTHELEKFISPSDLKTMLNDLKCKSSNPRGAWYNVFTGKFYTTSFNHFWYALHAVKS